LQTDSIPTTIATTVATTEKATEAISTSSNNNATSTASTTPPYLLKGSSWPLIGAAVGVAVILAAGAIGLACYLKRGKGNVICIPNVLIEEIESIFALETFMSDCTNV